MTANLTFVPHIRAAIQDLILQVSLVKRRNPLAPVSILLPTTSVIQDLSGKLGTTLGVQMVQFYQLGNAVLDQAGISTRVMSDAAIRRLLHSILHQLFSEGRLTTFMAVYDKPGFTEVLLSWVREMKSQGISPEQYFEFANQVGKEKDQQLAEIYARYQNFMHQNDYSDPDGLLWVVAEALENDPSLFQTAGPLFVSGFDQFTPIQLRILEQMKGRFASLEIYLPWDARRKETDRALARLVQTRDAILQKFSCQTRFSQSDIEREPDLAYLHDTLFRSDENKLEGSQAIRVVEAPSREIEVKRTILEIKQLLLSGVSPKDIAVLAPQPALYLPLVRSISSEYGVPVEYDLPLSVNPAIMSLVRLLHLGPDFPWRETLECLRSPYIQQVWLSAEQVDWLDQLSRERMVISGRDQWAAAIAPLLEPVPDFDDEDFARPGLAAELENDRLRPLRVGLDAFFDHLTPPTEATYSQYTSWIQGALVGLFPGDEPASEADREQPVSLNLLDSAISGPYPERDTQALAFLMRALRTLLTAVEIDPSDQLVSWETYRAELMEIVQPIRIPADTDQLLVRFSRLEEGRARQAEYLFVLGLSEGEFPVAQPIDVFYAPSERESHPLPLIRFTPADDACLWWQVLGNVRRQLILLRPYIDDKGAPWQASPYWDAVLERFSALQVETIPIAEHPTIDKAASIHELLIALAYGGALQAPIELSELWSYTQQAQAVLQQRQSYQPPGEFEGVFSSADLVEEMTSRFGRDHIWSASRLNRYANCPYGFFAEYVLQLAVREEPQDGLNAMHWGSLLHAVLEHLFRNLAASNLEVCLPNMDEILSYLDQSCKVVFATAPGKFGFRAGALWEYEQGELRRMLGVLLSSECEANGEGAAYHPYLLEAAFGFQNSAPALEIQLEDLALKLHGFIDRIDRDAGGNLRVIDYKSGSTKYSKNDIEKGLALQTVFYALAAERNWLAPGAQVKESYYLHIPKREPSGRLVFREKVEENELVESALQQVARNVQLIRRGVFPSAPGQPSSGSYLCRDHCDFAPICRVSRESIRKARRAGLA